MHRLEESHVDLTREGAGDFSPGRNSRLKCNKCIQWTQLPMQSAKTPPSVPSIQPKVSEAIRGWGHPGRLSMSQSCPKVQELGGRG
ncbi:hypothetical protein T440DRAFT_463578 [Plenodomus tracheiphilus IPT5]|uniref:Uncharacterized protein n=1 Tax=Plenodomus tracheiphilus IPT5 TaxID=1408161 RepID=A0A6A7BLH3_9PLEO|nr:hypothetical protein T440DRAFT_463578 [Plenodomus tracheiphilus IPT5]